jgi:hypothetical protein
MTFKNELVNQNFASIDINTSVQAAIEFINTDQPDYLVIEDPKKKKYYLQQSKDALPALNGLNNTVDLKGYLKAFDVKQVTVIDLKSVLKGFKKEALVVEQGQIICVLNPELPGTLPAGGTLEEGILSQLQGKSTGARRGGSNMKGLFPAQSPAPGGAVGKGLGPSRGVEESAGIPTSGGERPPDEPSSTPSGPSTYYLNAACKDKAALEEDISLLISIDKKSMSAAAPVLLLMAGAEVEIVVSPKSGFQVKGKDHGVIQVNGEEESKKCLFKLTATSPGEGRINVLAYLDGMEIAKMEIVVQISPEKLVEETEDITTTASKGISLIKPQVEPDVTLLVEEQTAANGQRQLYFRIKSPNVYFERFGPEILEKDPVKYFQDFFKDIEDLDLSTKEQKQIAQLALESKGRELYTALIPQGLRKHLWELKGKIKTVIINSEEPWIPWEVCYFFSEEDNEEEGGFFWDLFEVSRWLTGTGCPKEKISFNNAALVVPGDSSLPYANDEKEDLTSLLTKVGGTVTDVSATFLELVNNMKKGTFSLWHFTGHGGVMEGGNPDKTYMILEEKQRFAPENINLVKTMGKSNPFVFFNACQIGQAAMGLTGIGGWAQKFLGIGASGFIGAYWSIYDKAAYQFAIKFYDGMLIGKTVAQAAQEARRSIKDGGDPTWLAYTVYAYPSARLEQYY